MNENRTQLEREIVWALVQYPDQFPRYQKVLAPEYFSDDTCKTAITTMQTLHATGAELNDINIFNESGIHVPMPASSTIGYADLNIATKKLTELYILERKHSLIDSLETEDDAFAVIEGVNRLSNEFASIIAAHSRVPKSVVLSNFIDILQRNRDGHILRVPTGFPSLDSWCHGGLKLGNMSFFGGGPGVGKTSFMLKLGKNAAERGYETTFLEGEMPMDEILSRLHGQHSHLPVHEIENGQHLDRIEEFVDHMNFIAYNVQTTFERNVRSLLAQIQEAIHDGSKLIIVDYLQVFIEKGGRAQDEFTKIKALSEGIRKLTLINNVHIIAASSLNRLEAGQDRLTLNSFYGGSQLGHDCNTAIILHESEELSVPGEAVRTVLADVVKNRGGSTGEFSILYTLETQDMVEMAHERVDGVQGRLPFNEHEEEPF